MAGSLAYTTEQWVEKARQRHGNKYDYSKVVYMGSKNEIVFTCPIHGNISQKAKKHLEGRGCRQCANEAQRKGVDKFIDEANEWHGNYYDYSLVDFTNIHEKVKITCPVHGVFEQKPAKHQRGQGCKRCKGREVWNQEDFLRKSAQVHRDAFDYSKVKYKKNHLKVEIICRECGHLFTQTPNSHFNGSGCPKCAGVIPLTDDVFQDLLREVHSGEIISLETFTKTGDSIRFRHVCGHEWKNRPLNVIRRKQGCRKCSNKKRSMSEATFKERLSEKHNGRIISLDKFINTTTPVRIKHIDCGKVWKVEPRGAMRNGCHDCANRKTNAEFRIELEEVHKGEIVALEPYKSVRDNITVKHLICGHVWRPNPSDLIGKFHGCPKCSSSKGNKKIDNFLSDRKVNFIREQRFEDCRFKNPLPFDFYLPEHEILIEFDGVQHFKVVEIWGGEEGLEERIAKDNIKDRWAKKNEIKLYRIRYDEDIEKRLERILIEIT